MEPIKPLFREALKDAHPGLTDAVIDQAEALLAERFMYDPETEPEKIQQCDQARAALLQREMPKFEQVLQRVSGH